MNPEGVYSSFKAYDIRGRVPEELDANFAADLGRAVVAEFSPRSIVVGRDVRHSGPELVVAFSQAVAAHGVEVIDIGVCGTEEIYHATASAGYDLGLMFTASHNPAQYNGIKIVKGGAVPVSRESGLLALRDRILKQDFNKSAPALMENASKDSPFKSNAKSYRIEYIEFLASQISHPAKLKIVMNPGNGCAALVLDRLLEHLPGEFILINTEPDGSFPNGVPNPLLPERRHDTSRAVIEHQADLGLAWDGDFDRCFFFDHQGNFVESYYLIGLLARIILTEQPGEKVIHDTRLYWNTVDEIKRAGGIPVRTKTGHAFMKERMRQEDALFGGEMSAHFYFRDFYYCDSGMLPWLKLLQIMGESGKSLAELVKEREAAYPCSGEINFRINEPEAAMREIHLGLAKEIREENFIDGLDADCGSWRFNLRTSNTEPLLRLNVESRGDLRVMREKTANLEKMLLNLGGVRDNG